MPWRSCGSPQAIAAWRGLTERAAEPNPFCEHWYLVPSLSALDPAGHVQLLCLHQGDALLGLMPVRREARYYGKPVPCLSAWTHPNSFLGLPLIAVGQEKAFWQAVLLWADRTRGAGLFLHLPDMPLSGPVYEALTAVLADQSRTCGIVQREERALLASDLSPEDYLAASLSGKKRKELRRQMKRLADLGSVDLTRETGGEALSDWTEAFLTLEAAGWKGQGSTALASHPETASLFRAALAGAAEAGKLERLTLSLGGAPIAMLASFVTAPGGFSYKTAFDETFARFSPGVQLQMENLNLIAHHDIAWVDSCAAADHPMIDHIWRERRSIGRLSIAIGGPAKRALFRVLLAVEMRRGQKAG